MRSPRRLGASAAAIGLIALQLFVGGGGAAAAALKPVDVGPVSMGASMNCNGARASVGDAWVSLSGDYVTVRDHCADGNPVMARITMKVNGQNKVWSCYNRSGAGSVVVCDYDWPEGFVGFKTVIFYAWDGIREYKMGGLRHWRDG